MNLNKIANIKNKNLLFLQGVMGSFSSNSIGHFKKVHEKGL